MQTPSSSENVSESGSLRIDDEDIDEEELLADSPPPTPVGDVMLKTRSNASKAGEISTAMFSNRRVVVRNADNQTNNENNLTNKADTGASGKGIFDRLDKKVIGVNESAKRKIQRIVINKWLRKSIDLIVQSQLDI